MRLTTVASSTAAVVAFATPMAAADSLLTFGYTDLLGEVVENTDDSIFVRIESVTNPDGLTTSGDVSMSPLDAMTGLPTSTETAVFNPGTMSAPGGGGVGPSVVIEITFSDLEDDLSSVFGTIVITDADGDTLSADFAGTATETLPNFVFADTSLSNISFSSDDGAPTFNGDTGDDLLINDPLLYGSLDINLVVSNDGTFAVALAQGAIITPAPAGAAALGMGGLVLARRRR